MSEKTLLSYLAAFRTFGDRPALYYKTGFRTFKTTYRELFDTAQQTANYFEQCGYRKGDRVILWGADSPEWVSAFLGCLIKGLVAIPLDLRGGPEFVKTIAEFTNASLLIINEPSREHFKSLHTVSFEELKKKIKPLPTEPSFSEEITPKDTVEILFTSGTTAEPKGVVLSHENICSNVESLHASFHGLDLNEKWLSLLPLSHIFQQTIGLFIPLRRGYSVTYLKILKSTSILLALEEDGITICPIVPRLLKLIQGGIQREVSRQKKDRVFNLLLKVAGQFPVGKRRSLFPALKQKFGDLKYFIVGGATLERELEDFWTRLGVPLLQGYGLTETSPVISCNMPDAHCLGSIGKVLPGVEVQLSQEKEIWVRGKTVFSGYYQNFEKTREVFEGEWFKTGDIGEFDSDHFLHFRGRKKDLIVTAGGLNIYPDDIEAALHDIKGVQESCVIGISRGEEEVIHAVLLLEDTRADPKLIVDQANAGLAEYQKIQSFSIWPQEDFPRTSTMKVKKNKVRQWVEGEALETEEKASKLQEVPPLYSLIARLAKVPAGDIRSKNRLGDDLGLSSLDRVELAAIVEEEFHFDTDDSFFLAETQVGEVEKLIETKAVRAGEDRWARWPLRPWVRAIRKPFQDFHIIPIFRFFCRLKVEGAEQLRSLQGPAIFVANHTSYFDAPSVLAALPSPIRKQLAVATWKELLETESSNPLKRLWKRFLYYYALVGFNSCPFSQSKGIKKSLEHVGWLVDREYHILFFPEGERTLTGKMSPFKEGIGMLVSTMKVPVVPVGIDGLLESYPRGRRFPRFGKVTVRFGKPLFFSEESFSNIAAFLTREVNKLHS